MLILFFLLFIIIVADDILLELYYSYKSKRILLKFSIRNMSYILNGLFLTIAPLYIHSHIYKYNNKINIPLFIFCSIGLSILYRSFRKNYITDYGLFTQSGFIEFDKIIEYKWSLLEETKLKGKKVNYYNLYVTAKRRKLVSYIGSKETNTYIKVLIKEKEIVSNILDIKLNKHITN